MKKDTFGITHIIGFTYGLVASTAFTAFIDSFTKQVTEPIITRVVDRTVGKNRKLQICKTTVDVNKVIVSFIQLVIILLFIWFMITLGIKPQGKLFN